MSRSVRNDRVGLLLYASSDGGPLGPAGVLVAQPFGTTSEWCAVMAFSVGGGDTRLLAHAVLPSPSGWEVWSAKRKRQWLTGFTPLAAEISGERPQLSTRVIRSAATGELERYGREFARQSSGKLGFPAGAAGDPWRKTRGARGGEDRRLAQVAARYVELLTSSASPKKDLAAELARPLNTVNSDLHRSRERGLLTSPGRGRAGGALTDRARQLLTSDGED